MRRVAFAAFACAALVACGPPETGVAARTTTVHVPDVEDEQARVLELGRVEARVLETIAASDPRLAERVGGVKEESTHAAAMKALVTGDTDAAIEDGALDFFSFTARERSLAEADKLVATAPNVERDGNAKLERELLVRLVAEEHARLDEERGLPRGASALIRATVETWTTPGTKEAAAVRDGRIARRLDEVRASLADAESSRLPRIALAELDDALDPLERAATPEAYPETAKAMARLRVALGDTQPQDGADAADWGRVAARLHAHLGVDATADALRARLEEAEHALRAEVTAHMPAGSDRGIERELAARAEKLTLAPAACGTPTVSSRLRSLLPPPERAALCGVLHAAFEATRDTGGSSREAALVALHDDVVVALWALAIRAFRTSPARATGDAHPFFGADPDREARLLRFGAVRPVAAIGAGLAAAQLAGDLPAMEKGVLAPWIGFGDAPMDIALRETSKK